MASLSGFGGGSLSGVFGGISGAVGDLFAGMGDMAEAGNYARAARDARAEEQFTKSAVRVQEMQATRQATMAIGGQRADIAGSGLAESGSAQDVLRDSAAQGALQQGLIQFQGAETEAGFEEKARSYDTMAEAAKRASVGADIAGVFSGLTSIANLATMGG